MFKLGIIKDIFSLNLLNSPPRYKHCPHIIDEQPDIGEIRHLLKATG